jgi:hypothetical protein
MTTESVELKSSAQWAEELDVKIVDPDGWDRTNFEEDWHRPISRIEFIQKASMSTIYHGMWDD